MVGAIKSSLHLVFHCQITRNRVSHAQTYFTADWHFSHPNIARYCPQFRQQSDNADELNEYLIDCWNRVVTPQDTVYNLGDVCFAKKPAHIEAVLQRLNGQHHLIYGNHDYLIRQNEAHFLNMRKTKRNRYLSKTRYVVEQSFGTSHRKFRYARAAYFGLLKVSAQSHLKAMCLNLLKAANRLSAPVSA